MISLQLQRGIYVLVLSVGKNSAIKVGALGKLFFKKGTYAYVGSAQSGLENRIRRHLSKRKRKFWHIDYILSGNKAKVLCVYCKEATKSEECRIASLLSRKYAFIDGFGCSDCKCPSHLFFFGDLDLKEIFSGLGFKKYWEKR
ncbi:MAG: GIY-YIG nuclease family protein [Candidatus Diapherotrites archaeon]